MKALLKSLFLLITFVLTPTVYADIHEEIQHANILLYQGRYEQAEASYTKLIPIASQEFLVGAVLADTLHIHRGIARLIQRKLEAAQEDIQACLSPQSSMMPKDAGYMLRARLHLMQGDRKSAFDNYDEMIKEAKNGMASDYRLAFAMAQRAWAHLTLGEAEAAKKDFEVALLGDIKIMGMNINKLQKPFWQAVVDEVIPLVESNSSAATINQAIDTLLDKQKIKEYALTTSTDSETMGNANSILIYEIYGPIFLLREKAQKQTEQEYRENTHTLFSTAQTALLKGDKKSAFEAFVKGFKNASLEDKNSRDAAIRGISSILNSGFALPPTSEEVRRLAIKAQVLAQDKNYTQAIKHYWDALKQAPWAANLHYDYALLFQEIAHTNAEFNTAITAMHYFILLSSNSTEKREAQDLIYTWEAKRDLMQAKKMASVAPPQGPYVARSATAGSSDCFIATAAYGTFLDPHVITLRTFRDQALLTNPLGQWLVERYYHYSPPIAQTIKEHEWLRTSVRMLLTPIIFAIEFPWILLCFMAFILLLRRVRGVRV